MRTPSLVVLLTLLVALLALPTPLLAQGDEEPPPAPPWPYREDARAERLFDRLEQLKLTVDRKDESLARLLAELSSAARLAIQADDSVDADELRVALVVKESTTMRGVLQRLCRDRPYTFVVLPERVVVTSAPQAYPGGNARYVREKLEKATLMPTLLGTLIDAREADERFARAVKTTHVSHRGLIVPAPQVPQALERAIGRPFQVKYVFGTQPTGGVKLAGSRGTIAALLDAVCQQLGYEWAIHRRVIYLGTKGRIAAKRQLAQQSRDVLEAQLRRMKPFDQTLVDIDAQGVPLRKLWRKLARQLAAPLHLDKATWLDDTPIRIAPGKRPFREVRLAIREQTSGRVSVVVTDGDALYAVHRPR